MALSLNISTFASASAAVVADYPFTLGGWFRVPNVAALLQLTGLENAAGDARYHLYYAGHSGGKVVANAYLGDYGRAISAGPMVPEQWQHVAGVFHSATLREIYLDGAIVGSNTASRAFEGDDYVYLGSKDSSTAVEVAEAFVAAAALTEGQIAALARGCSPLGVVGLASLPLYQDALARFNRPGVGVVLSSSGTPAMTAHPRVVAGAACGMIAAPYRVAGPWVRQAAGGFTAGAAAGQADVAGLVVGEIAYAEVQS
jgi:hypothetical protein